MTGGSGDDDAIAINVTPLIDIIFCLCIFFMCSFHFKQLQGSLDSWLPRDVGTQTCAAARPVVLDDIRIFVRNRPGGSLVTFGAREVGSFDELEDLVRQELADHASRSRGEAPSVIIDGEPGVPWKDVVSVLDRLKKLDVPKVEFAQPLPASGTR